MVSQAGFSGWLPALGRVRDSRVIPDLTADTPTVADARFGWITRTTDGDPDSSDRPLVRISRTRSMNAPADWTRGSDRGVVGSVHSCTRWRRWSRFFVGAWWCQARHAWLKSWTGANSREAQAGPTTMARPSSVPRGACSRMTRDGGFNSPALRVRFTRRYGRRSLRDQGTSERRARRAHERCHE